MGADSERRSWRLIVLMEQGRIVAVIVAEEDALPDLALAMRALAR